MSEIPTYARHAQKFLAQLILYATTKYSRIPFSNADCYQGAVSIAYLTLEMYLRTIRFRLLPSFSKGNCCMKNTRYHTQVKNMSQYRLLRFSEIDLYIKQRKVYIMIAIFYKIYFVL